MNTLTITLITISILSILLNFYLVYMYTGKIKDDDKDMIADVAEEAAAEIKERAQRVVQEMKDVGEAVKEVGNQIGDIPSAVTGKTRVGRKPKK
jgi:fructoselysine-6-P-deglycase FrlB-like protein